MLALGFHSSNTPVAPEVRASLSLPRESDKERPGSPPGPRAGRQTSSGGCRPGLPLDSRPNPGLHWPPGRIGAPCAAGPGRGASAQPATGRGRFWADPAPLGRMQEISPPTGPKGSLVPSTNLVAGQAAGPLGKSSALQNCPRLYQGESGGLEPSTKPVAGQAGAPLHSLSPLRGPGGLPGQSLATFF